MNLPDLDPRLLDLLSRAGSLELFQLKSVIERMLADPKRIVQIRKDLHLGQTVHFLNARNGQIHSGKVLAMKDTQATILDGFTRSSHPVPYAAILPPPTPQGPSQPSARAPEAPTPPRPGRNDFRCGEKVAFEDKHLNTVVGLIVRINQRTATIDPGDGTSWRVGFALLRHVVDI
jgi:hypothetical protein